MEQRQQEATMKTAKTRPLATKVAAATVTGEQRQVSLGMSGENKSAAAPPLQPSNELKATGCPSLGSG